jgi:hypothetical protein
MIPFLFTPIGKYLALAAIALVLGTGVYWKIRSDAIAEEQARRQQIELERMRDAIRAGDAVNVDPERLRDTDRFSRD